MEIRTPRHRCRRVTLGIVILATLAACSTAPQAPLGVSDWCWLHYRLAPRDALGTDAGPPSAEAAREWVDWLDATADAPGDRRPAHDRMRELVGRFASTGWWSDADRTRYVAEAHAEPTAATVCETVGARMDVDPGDGGLPADWEQRFLDPRNPAYSDIASGSDGES